MFTFSCLSCHRNRIVHLSYFFQKILANNVMVIMTTLVRASGFGMLKSVLSNTFNTELSMIRPAGACMSRRASSRSDNKQSILL